MKEYKYVEMTEVGRYSYDIHDTSTGKWHGIICRKEYYTSGNAVATVELPYRVNLDELKEIVRFMENMEGLNEKA